MRPEIQVNLITEQRKHLEEYLQVLGPVVESMKHALEKSKSWIEDRNDNPSITHMELCQELESVTTALLGAASHIIGRNKNNCCDNKATAFPTAPQTTATEKADGDLGLLAHHVTKQQTAQILTRIEMIETALSLLQDTKQKTEDDISEIKQWRENFLSEQNDTAEKFFRQQTENIGSLRQQINEQDNKVKELNKEFESLKEKESKSNKTLERLSLDMIEHANNLHTINKEMQVHTNKTDSITQEVRIHCSIISTLQDNTASKFKDMFAKIDKKMQDVLNFKAQIQDVLKLEIKVNNVLKFEQKVKDYLKLEQKVNDIMNFELRMKEILKLEEKVIDVLKLSPVVHSIESRVCNRYLCHIQLANSTPVGWGSIIATFSEVREYFGNCFNQTTGKFVAPQDGLYLLCLTLQQWADKQVRVGIYVGEKWSQTVQVKYAGTSASGSVVVVIKKGQSIYLHVDFADQGAKLSSLSSFTIVSL